MNNDNDNLNNDNNLINNNLNNDTNLNNNLNNNLNDYDVKKKECVLCRYNGSGDDALLKMHSKYNVYNNHFVCVSCFQDVVETNINSLTGFDNNGNVKQKFKKVKCEWCKTSSKNREVFEIFWKGKFNGHYMCYLCIHSKEHRRNSVV